MRKEFLVYGSPAIGEEEIAACFDTGKLLRAVGDAFERADE